MLLHTTLLTVELGYLSFSMAQKFWRIELEIGQDNFYLFDRKKFSFHRIPPILSISVHLTDLSRLITFFILIIIFAYFQQNQYVRIATYTGIFTLMKHVTELVAQPTTKYGVCQIACFCLSVLKWLRVYVFGILK